MSYYVKKIYIEVVRVPEYFEPQNNFIVNIISRYPNTSFLGYLLLHNYFFPRRYETTIPIDTIYVLCKLSMNVLFFQGFALHYLPNTILSCVVRALLSGLIYKSPHILLYCFFTSLSRLRNPLSRVLINKLLCMSLVLFLNKLC